MNSRPVKGNKKLVPNMSGVNRVLKPGDPVPKPPKPRLEDEIIAQWNGDIAEPLVSIVCHSFNHESFIEDALNGFLMQETKFPFEIIIHDDASTDNTQKIIKEYSSKYPRIVKLILQKENIYMKGLRPPMFSFPKAKGKYIAFCEGDDYWIDKKKIMVQVEFLENNADYSVCYTDSIPFKDGIVVDRDYGGARKDLSDQELQRGPAIYTLTSCFRNILDNPPELSMVKYGDKFIWSRLGKIGKGKFLRGITPSFYRVHSAGVHSSSTIEDKIMMYIQTYSAMAAYYKRLGDEDLCRYYLNKLSQQVYAYDGVNARIIPLTCFISRVLRKIKRLLR